MGAAWLAGQRAGILPGMAEFAASWTADTRFEPKMEEGARAVRYAAWKRAVAATLSFAE